MNAWIKSARMLCAVMPVHIVALGAQAQPDGLGGKSAFQSVLPDRPTNIVLSNVDINRIVCVSGDIEGHRFSEEKGLVIDTSGQDAFVKFQIEVEGDEHRHVVVRSEIYIQCAGVTYTLLAKPVDIEAQTVYLVAGATRHKEQNIALFAPLSEEDRAVKLSVDILRDEIPATFSVHAFEDPYQRHILPKLDIRLRREVSVLGTDYWAREYLLRARARVNLAEHRFLTPFFGPAIYAVTLAGLSLEGGEVGRVVIIYRGDRP
ncbi:TraK domain-containing protein [Eilatimonas milleporae]|uniref:TraK protein n=1 Tax=Eilatimonas milleporae TaxID=911205 RepID=A0A3M0CP30_9PROT|nr:type-F conjugative transfer system secretin TraK [Eilatimonas milleporae]RMB05043.1 TraK protein [Eilatimonas milleporae]